MILVPGIFCPQSYSSNYDGRKFLSNSSSFWTPSSLRMKFAHCKYADKGCLMLGLPTMMTRMSSWCTCYSYNERLAEGCNNFQLHQIIYWCYSLQFYYQFVQRQIIKFNFKWNKFWIMYFNMRIFHEWIQSHIKVNFNLDLLVWLQLWHHVHSIPISHK